MKDFFTWENVNNLLINIFLLIIIIFAVLIYVSEKTQDRFHGSSMDLWIEQTRSLNKGKGIVFPDRIMIQRDE